MDPTLIVNIVLAVAAVGSMVVAIVATVMARNSAAAAQRLVDIENERRTDELAAAQRAAVDARRAILDATLAGSDQLVIRNLGQCRAMNVQLELESDDEGRQPPMMLFDEPREIGAGLNEAWKVISRWGSAADYTVHMTWTDREGQHEDLQRVHI